MVMVGTPVPRVIVTVVALVVAIAMPVMTIPMMPLRPFFMVVFIVSPTPVTRMVPVYSLGQVAVMAFVGLDEAGFVPVRVCQGQRR